MIRVLLSAALFVSLICAPAARAQQYVRTWSYPVDPDDDYNFGSGGFLSSYLSPKTNKIVYHLGEDWNLVNGDDYAKPVHATADGVVTRVVLPTPNTPDDFNGEVHIEHTLPGGRKIESVYLHLSDISYEAGWKVYRGDEIAKIGNGNGRYASHLHFEIRRKSDGITRKNPYAALASKQPATSGYNSAKDYLAPSVHIDDIGYEKTIPLNNGKYADFRVEEFSRQSTAYVTFESQTLTLIQAFQREIVSLVEVYLPTEGTYKRLSGLKWFFLPDNDFRIKAKRAGVTLHIPRPLGDPRFFATRARVDLVNALTALRNLYHLDIDSGEVIQDSTNDPWRVVRYKYYRSAADKSAGRFVYAKHVLNKDHVIVRYVHPDGDDRYVAVNPNLLQ